MMPEMVTETFACEKMDETFNPEVYLDWLSFRSPLVMDWTCKTLHYIKDPM